MQIVPRKNNIGKNHRSIYFKIIYQVPTLSKYLHYNSTPVAVFNYEVLNRKQSHREPKQFILNTIHNGECRPHGFETSALPESLQHVTSTARTVLIKIPRIDSHLKVLCLRKDHKQRLQWLRFLVIIT